MTDVVAAGATTTNEVARVCGAGADCGRCRRTVQAILRSRGPDRNTFRA